MRTLSEFKKILQKAFKELENKHDITSRQNYACCRSCGIYEIEEERPDSFGWCFYHMQDAEGLRENGMVYLAFGSANREVIPVGNKIVSVLNKHNIVTEWNGDPSTRILVYQHELGIKAEAEVGALRRTMAITETRKTPQERAKGTVND